MRPPENLYHANIAEDHSRSSCRSTAATFRRGSSARRNFRPTRCRWKLTARGRPISDFFAAWNKSPTPPNAASFFTIIFAPNSASTKNLSCTANPNRLTALCICCAPGARTPTARPVPCSNRGSKAASVCWRRFTKAGSRTIARRARRSCWIARAARPNPSAC